jgi:putative transcriptional regulator
MTAFLSGQLLVATPVLEDPNFRRSVVLVLDHDEEGAIGVVINRPSEVAVGAVLNRWAPLVTGEPVLWMGGPVGVDSALGVGRVPGADEPLGFRAVPAPGLGLVDLDADPDELAPRLSDVRIFAGYAGWGAGQLEEELGDGGWYLVAAQPGDAFTTRPERLWREVLRRQGGDLALVSTYPDDPSDN